MCVFQYSEITVEAFHGSLLDLTRSGYSLLGYVHHSMMNFYRRNVELQWRPRVTGTTCAFYF